MDPPEPAAEARGAAGAGRPLLRGGPLDTSGLVGGLAALQMRWAAGGRRARGRGVHEGGYIHD